MRNVFSRSSGRIRLIALLILAVSGMLPLWLWADAPAWWAARGVLNSNTADDYAVVNQGQVKHIAKQAYLEMQEEGLIAANSPLTAIVEGWATPGPNTDDYKTINLGQLKNIAEPFYARLVDELGYSGQPLVSGQTRPWSGTGADDYAVANIGQVKNVFSFNLSELNTGDSDDDGLPDAWEIQYFGNLNQSAGGNLDDDGLDNLQEYQNGTNPSLSDTDGDEMNDGYELANGLNPLLKDSFEDKDGDGVPNLWETKLGSSPSDGESLPAATFVVSPAYVDPGTGGTPVNGRSSIQSAIDSVTGGSSSVPVYALIEVREGSYAETVQLYDSYERIALIARPTAPTAIVEIRGSYYYDNILYISEPSVVSGFRITRQMESGQPFDYYGTGINIDLNSSDAQVELSNCVINGHRSYQVGAIYVNQGDVTLRHVTLFDNFSVAVADSGNAAYVYQGTLRVENSIVWGQIGGGAHTIYRNTDYGTVITGGSIVYGGEYGAANVDPLLGPDGVLKVGSPAINFGQASSGLLADIHGEARVGIPDAGADEFVDADGDGLPDFWELKYFGNLIDQAAAGNADSDTLDNLAEYNFGSDPTLGDADNDGLEDGAEQLAGTSPRVGDTDSDGMNDGYEVANGSDPHADDSLDDKDGDRIPNIFECKHQSAANNPGSIPASTFIIDPIDGALNDTDNIYVTIGEALSKVNDYEWNGSEYVYPNKYAVIEVHSGIYIESAYVEQPVLLLGQSEAGFAPVEIRSPSEGYALYIAGAAVVDGITVTHVDGVWGGGIYVASYYSDLVRSRLVNCVIRGNKDSYGAGVYNSGGVLDLVHCTITENNASELGRGIYNEYGVISLLNTIVWGNTGLASQEIYADITEGLSSVGSIIYGGEHGGVNSDPLLTPLGLLKAGSPAINLGQVLVGTLKDRQGESRIGLPDAGADEFVDSNGDGVPDNFGGGLAAGNPDGDTLNNLAEYNYGTDPALSDTDADGLEDGAEQIAGTNPRSFDSDGDGMKDGYEVSYGLNPLNGTDALLDLDGDLVPNLWESKLGTAADDAASSPPPTAVVSAGTTIMAAVNAVPAGTISEPNYVIIEVQEGVYAENVELTDSSTRIALIARPTTLGASVEICGSYYYSAVIHITEPSVVSGFRVTRQFDVSQPASSHGTGLSVSLANQTKLVLIENCVIYGHRSSQSGALRIDQGDVTLRHVTMYDNLASVGGSYGNAAYVGQGTLRLQNSIVWGQAGGASNTIYRNPNYATVTTTGSIVYGGEYGGLNADPLLNQRGLLKTGSPAINLGQVAVGTIKDWQGEARIGLPDAGVDEFVDSNGDGVPDNFGGGLATGNPDGDTLNNLEEYNYGTDPTLSDGDNDGLEDGAEQAAGTNPWSSDSDGDGMKDGYEVTNALKPLEDDALSDFDGDLVPNLWEAKLGTVANNASSKPTTNAVVATTGGTHTTIQAAINGLSGGATAEPLYAIIEVREGSYAEYVQLTNSARRIALIAKPTTALADVVLSGAIYYNYVLNIAQPSVVSGFRITRQLDASQPANSHGTGVYVSLTGRERALIENCVIHGHRSSQAGAVRVNQGDVSLRHVTMYDNLASVGGSYGNAVYVNQGTLRVQNSIVWGQTGGASNTIYRNPNYATVTTTGSVVYGGEYGGLNADPLLNQRGLLKTGSPAINLGQVAVGTIKDRQGEARIGLPDAGADEFVDSNGDGVPDNFGGGLATGNPDGDTLNNLEEYNYGTDPTLSDGDNDGLEDGAEQTAGTNPWSSDSDGDGMKDGYEVTNALKPLEDDALSDFDGDLVPNLWEAKLGTVANNASSKPTTNAVVATTGGTHTTIQAAINGLSGGTTAEPLYAIIEVREGSYAEYVQLTNSARRIALIAKPTTQLADVVLRGAGYSNNVLYITRTSVVSGFHITRQLDLSQPTSSHATGIYLSLSSATNQALIENCVIHGHRSSQAGALRIDQGDVTLRHVTMYDNAASVGNSYGNAVYINQGTLRVQNSIVWGQAGGAGNTIYRNPNYATVATTGSIVYGGEHGGLNTDPLINPLGLLKAGSPAINLGLTAVGTIKDKQGEIRLGLPDAGADEYVDSNGDGVPDNFGGGLATGNPDGDTLDNLSEYQYGSDPTLSDTDGDGLADGVEQIAGTNPRSDDSDTDGMRDAYEVANALNPLDGGDALLDKDGDLVPNLWEAKRGTEANNASSVPTANAVTAASGGTHTTIQAAINGLSGGTSAEPLYAIIEVREGSYAEYIQLTNSTRRIALIAKPTVSSAEVELRGAGYNNHVLYITQPSVVNGFRITRQLDASQPVTNHSVGIYVYLGNLTHQALIENCVIHGHRSSQAGALQVDQGDVTLRHVTMYDNIASVGNSYGNAVYINQGALRVQNSIVWGQAGGASNTIYRNPNYATVTTTGSIVYGGEHGGVNTDPLINPVGLLKSGSPAINLGVTAVGAIKDKQGEIRLGLPDAGADEFVDSNGDGVPDNFGGGLATGNPDGDTLDNLTEYQYGSNPTLSDTDGDGLADGVEQAAGTNPRSDDSDTDGMKDAYEVANALNPLDGADALLDKDGDLVPNLWEAKRGTEANNASSVPTANAVTAASGGTHTTIQAAINGLSGGTSTEPLYAIIEVREGSYAEYIQLTNNTRRIALIAKPTVSSAEVELRGGSYNNYVLYITQPSVVSGFRITRQLNPNQSAANHSTGVYLALGNSINRALIANCVIQGHRSSVVGGLRINQGDVTLRHVTMYDNLASNGSSYGNAIYIDQGVLRVQNSIIWGQAAGASSTIYRSGSYATVTVVGSIVYGGEHGGVNADPLINPLGLLRAGSPAINLGQAVIGTAKDRQAESRIGLPDAGADEFVDTDGDELADLWEIQHFGNLTSQTGGGDSDSDGRTNVLEYNRGTSPVAYDGVDQVVVSQSVDAASATPTATISFYSYTAQTVTLKFHKFYFEQSTVTNGFGAHHFDLIDTHTLSAHIGLNTYQWNGLIPGVSPTFHDADVVAVEVVSLGGPTPVSVGAPAAYIPASVFDGWSSSSNLYPATFGRLPYENTFLESNYSVTRPLMMVTPSCLSVLPRVPIVPGSNKLVRWVPMDDTGAGWATTNPDPTNVHAKELPVNAIVYLNNRPEVTDFTVQAFRTTPSNGEVVHARFSLSRATKVSLIMADPALMHSILYVRMPNGTYQEATDLELSAGSHDLEFRALNYDGGINDPRHFSYEKIRELSEAGLFRVRITWEQDVRIQDGYVQQATGFRWAYVHVQ